MLQQQKIENIKKISCKKLIEKKQLESLTKKLTYHRYSTLRKMQSKQSRKNKSFSWKGGEECTREKNSGKKNSMW